MSKDKKSVAVGRNFYFDGQHGPEDPADAAARLALVAERDQLLKEVDYYRAGLERREPKWVPSRVNLPREVRGDFPFQRIIARAGAHDCQSNTLGAISVMSENLQWLGVKPAEFRVLEWRENVNRTGDEG